MADEAEEIVSPDPHARNSVDRTPFDDWEFVDRIATELVKRGGILEGGEVKVAVKATS
jgi:hypothetical protein